MLVQFAQTTPATQVSAQLQVATAFPGAQAVLPIGADDNLAAGPFEHQFAANGSSVYAVLPGPTVTGDAVVEADIYASTDSGRTFTGPTRVHTGNLSCATIAVDPGNPNVVYLEYFAGHNDTTSNTGMTLRLAVSTDGAKTFPTEYDIFDSTGEDAAFLCPDLAAPSPNHVIVAGASGLVAGSGQWHVTSFVSSNQGAGIGPVSTQGTIEITDGGTGSVDTNTASASDCIISSNSGDTGPRVISNGSGIACLVYRYKRRL